MSWQIRGRAPIDGPLLVGIVNVTPDSFSDGGRFFSPEQAIEHGRRLIGDGADIVDVGGESTRPGAEAVSEEEESRRVLPVIEALASGGAVVSVDTSKPTVAWAAIEAGAVIVNDVSASPEMVEIAARTGAGLVMMHMQGTPRTMQVEPTYVDVVREVRDFLVQRAAFAIERGVDRSQIVIDPGIGFGKTLDHNLDILTHIDVLVGTGYPVLIGTSRKSFLGLLTGETMPERRDLATAATTALAVAAGVFAVRVHNVAVSRPAMQVADAMVRNAGVEQ
ncbi:MAG: dihydropteroate synthase [Acidimicrobiia bacterium]